MHAVVTATVPRRAVSGPVFEQMRVRVFETEDEAREWAVKHPHYITEVVPAEVVPTP